MRYKKATAGILAGASMIGGGAAVDAQINPYTNVGTQKEIMADSVIPEAKAIRILADTTKPKVIMEKFGGEVAMGVSYNKIKAHGSRPLFSKNMEWDGGNEKMEMVPIDATTTMEDGGMEINIHLASKPASNVFTFTLDNWQNLDFFYQPPLTAKDIAEGVSRPDNVVGSYAVYYKNHANHIVGQTNYATGKAYHIFRPKVIDNNGVEVWGELSYGNGILSVTVPQDFLDSASYPVKVDPTFGYTTVGANAISRDTINSNRAEVSSTAKYTASLGDTVTQMSVYARCLSSGSGTIGAAVYTFSGGVPVTRLFAELTVTIDNSSPQWFNSGTISTVMSAGTVYVVADGNWNKGTCGTELDTFYDATGGAGDVSIASGGALPATWSQTSTDGNLFSVYATYTAGSGASTPTAIYGATLQGATIY